MNPGGIKIRDGGSGDATPPLSTGDSLPPVRAESAAETSLVRSLPGLRIVARLGGWWNALWRRGVGGRPPSVNFDYLMPAGARRVDTHDGSYLAYWQRRHPESGRPEVVIVGELSIFAEIVERLMVANDGLNVAEFNSSLFPHNRAMESIQRWASGPSKTHRTDRGLCNFANAAEVILRSDRASGLYEGTYTVPTERFVPGIGHDHIPLLDPEKIPAMWQWVLARYLEDRTYERTVSRMVEHPPTVRLMGRAFDEVIAQVDARVIANLRRTLKRRDALAPLARPLDKEVWSAEVGVRLDRAGMVSAVVVELYNKYPHGMWGSTDSIRRMSSATVWTGRPSADGKSLEWTVERFGEAGPNFAAMLGAAVTAHVASGGEKTTVKWSPPTSHRPMPDPLDQFPRPPCDLPEVPEAQLLGTPIKRDDAGSHCGGSSPPPSAAPAGLLPAGPTTGSTPGAGGTLSQLVALPIPTALPLLGAQTLLLGTLAHCS